MRRAPAPGRRTAVQTVANAAAGLECLAVFTTAAIAAVYLGFAPIYPFHKKSTSLLIPPETRPHGCRANARSLPNDTTREPRPFSFRACAECRRWSVCRRAVECRSVAAASPWRRSGAATPMLTTWRSVCGPSNSPTGPASQPTCDAGCGIANWIVAKLEWFRMGDNSSQRQWDDVCRLVALHGPVLDLAHIRRRAESVGVIDLLERLLATQEQ